MATIYRAPEQTALNFSNKSIFLAGSIDMGRAKLWQQVIEEELKEYNCTIFNPRRLDFDPTVEYSPKNLYMKEQIEWELKYLDIADIVVFYFDINGKAPISLYEVGRVSHEVASGKKKGLIYCPIGYWKRANVIINGEYDGFEFAESEEIFIDKIKMML